MNATIGHASQNENKKTTGGIAGDQTGKEVYIRSWYAKNWDYVLRCTNTGLANIMATTCEKACNNNYIGYDQNQRNSLKKQAQLVGYNLSQINVACSCDCSSLMAVCAESAGIKIPYSGGNAPTTKTMKKAFTSTGFFKVLTGTVYTATPDSLQRGDILVKEGSHTVMVLTNNSKPIATTTEYYIKNNVYTTDVNLYIRETPYGNKKKADSISADAQKNSSFDEYGYAILNKGTRVTCLDIDKLEDSTWIKIPSGWICALKSTTRYIK